MINLTPQMSESALLQAARNMESYGGSFAASIAQAYFVADMCNRIRLLSTFGDMFERFAPTETTGGETA
jgi:hypothetical protein